MQKRIITAAVITSGEKTDGKELCKLVEKSKKAGIEVENVVGDKAYSSRENIEAKNSELKNRHGYDVASSSSLISMEMQGAMTIFAVNLKRIIKLISEK